MSCLPSTTWTSTSLFNELVKSTDAYKNGNIIYLTSEAWYTIAGGVNSTLTMLNDLEAIIK